jgi:hypothetical protein
MPLELRTDTKDTKVRNRGRDPDHRAVNQMLAKIVMPPDDKRCPEPNVQSCSLCGFSHYTPRTRCIGCGEVS